MLFNIFLIILYCVRLIVIFFNETTKYVDFQMEEIRYDSSSLYSGLVSAITSQLMIDVNINDIEIN